MSVCADGKPEADLIRKSFHPECLVNARVVMIIYVQLRPRVGLARRKMPVKDMGSKISAEFVPWQKKSTDILGSVMLR